MAIKPSDCIKISQREKWIVKGIEKHLDEYLLKHFSGKGCICYTPQVTGWNNPKIVRAIITKYKAAGWKKVEYKTEQRDGEWLVFYA